MPRMTVAGTDRVTWMEWDERLRQMVHKTLRRGESGDVPDEVVARCELIQAKELEDHLAGRVIDHRAGHVRLVPEGEYGEYTSEVVLHADPVARFTDEEIRGWDVNTTVAQMNQTPGLAARIVELEESRTPPRKTVLAHAQRLIDAQEGRDVSLAGEPAAEAVQLVPAEES